MSLLSKESGFNGAQSSETPHKRALNTFNEQCKLG
jgi:hypothetical protein